jgi:hypothetical protein
VAHGLSVRIGADVPWQGAECRVEIVGSAPLIHWAGRSRFDWDADLRLPAGPKRDVA